MQDLKNKREIITIDEKKLQNIIAGDYGNKMQEEPKSPDPIEESFEKQEEAENQPIKPSKRKKIQLNYEEVFLQKSMIKDRRVVSLYLEFYLIDKINELLKVSKDNISMSVFVNNILRLHIDEYKDEINELYSKPRTDLI